MVLLRVSLKKALTTLDFSHQSPEKTKLAFPPSTNPSSMSNWGIR